MGFWIYYFVLKLGLYWTGAIGLDPTYNLGFAVFVAFPLERRAARIVRQVLAVPLGTALFYHDSYFPGLDRVLEVAPDLGSFSAGYVLELLGRFFDPQEAVALVVGCLLVFLIGKRVRIATLVFLGLASMPPLKGFLEKPDAPPTALAQSCPAPDQATANAAAPPLTEDGLDAYLAHFYDAESQRQIHFAKTNRSGPPPFDIVLFHICSLAWSDIDPGERASLFANFDLVFQGFNSAASYSGPAAIRLLRASCGQVKHEALYTPPAPQCFLFDGLVSLGYRRQYLMNHDGHFGGFIGNVTSRSEGGLDITPLGDLGAGSQMRSFDNTPIYEDFDLLNRWWTKRLANPDPSVALYYNTISLHDGNVLQDQKSASSMKTYPDRMHRLVADIGKFMGTLEQSGKPVLLVVVAEHGAALHGEKNFIAGMREIPAPSITEVPLAIKFIGLPQFKPATPIVTPKKISYLALAELIRKATESPSSGLDAAQLIRELPETAFVSTNDTTTVIGVSDRYWLKAGVLPWSEYGKK